MEFYLIFLRYTTRALQFNVFQGLFIDTFVINLNWIFWIWTHIDWWIFKVNKVSSFDG